MLKCNSSHLWLLAGVGMGKEFDYSLVTTLATQIELEGFFFSILPFFIEGGHKGKGLDLGRWASEYNQCALCNTAK